MINIINIIVYCDRRDNSPTTEQQLFLQLVSSPYEDVHDIYTFPS